MAFSLTLVGDKQRFENIAEAVYDQTSLPRIQDDLQNLAAERDALRNSNASPEKFLQSLRRLVTVADTTYLLLDVENALRDHPQLLPYFIQQKNPERLNAQIDVIASIYERGLAPTGFDNQLTRTIAGARVMAQDHLTLLRNPELRDGLRTSLSQPPTSLLPNIRIQMQGAAATICEQCTVTKFEELLAAQVAEENVQGAIPVAVRKANNDYSSQFQRLDIRSMLRFVLGRHDDAATCLQAEEDIHGSNEHALCTAFETKVGRPATEKEAIDGIILWSGMQTSAFLLNEVLAQEHVWASNQYLTA